MRDFLNAELAKYETWNELVTTDKNISGCISNKSMPQKRFNQLKETGVGRDTILKFMGGNWKGWVIEESLAVLKSESEGKVERHAILNNPSLLRVL